MKEDITTQSADVKRVEINGNKPTHINLTAQLKLPNFLKNTNYYNSSDMTQVT